MSFLKTQVIFPSEFASVFSAIKCNSFKLFFRSNIRYIYVYIYFVQKQPINVPFLRFLSVPVKSCQNHHVNFELKSQFLFEFHIILHCYYTKLPCKLQAHTFSTLGKTTPSKSKFLDFRTCFGENLLNSSCHF